MTDDEIHSAMDLINQCFDLNNVNPSVGVSALLNLALHLLYKAGMPREEFLENVTSHWDKMDLKSKMRGK